MSRSTYRPSHYFGGAGPRWFRNRTVTRPQRREAQRLARAIVTGADPDALQWLPWNRPRVYWW